MHTNYEHGEGRVVWAGTRKSHTDCGGFLDALLMHSYGYDRDQFKQATGRATLGTEKGREGKTTTGWARASCESTPTLGERLRDSPGARSTPRNSKIRRMSIWWSDD